MNPGDRVRVTRGDFSGWHGSIVPNDGNDEPGWRRVKLSAGDTRLFPVDWLERETAKKIPLLEYLDKLEATAKEASEGTWGAANWSAPDPRTPPHDTIESHRPPQTESERSIWKGDVGIRIAEINEECDNEEANRAHILATQPKATLALIAKLREAIGIVQAAWSAHIIDANHINQIQDRVVAWASEIEVPE